jgi:hypothetical protein
VVNGQVGVYPGTAITGFRSAMVNQLDSANAGALNAQRALAMAYDTVKGWNPTADLSNQDLGDMTLPPGVYKFAAAALLTGVLTLDAKGDPNAVWTFQIGSAITFAINSQVVFLSDVGNAEYVYWQVGSAATLNPGAAIIGNILAYSAITASPGVTMKGRLLAMGAAVTIVSSEISTPSLPLTGGRGGIPRRYDSASPTITPPADPKTPDTPIDLGNPIDLGEVSTYAILAGSTVTSAGAIGTVVTGDIGVYPGTAVTGFGPGMLAPWSSAPLPASMPRLRWPWPTTPPRGR